MKRSILLAKLFANTVLVRGPLALAGVALIGLGGGGFALLTGGSFFAGAFLGLFPIPVFVYVGYLDINVQFKNLTGGSAYLFQTVWGEYLTGGADHR